MSLKLVRVKIKGLGFILWHARHMFYHVLLGLVWAWFLRERWNQFNTRWIWLSVFGSLLPDADHMLYFWSYGRKDPYTKQVKNFFAKRQWRNLTIFMETGHKHNTNLSYHNYYVVASLLVMSLLSSRLSWEIGVILFGAMVIHYLFDVVDDVIILGHINPNWKRWGKSKASA